MKEYFYILLFGLGFVTKGLEVSKLSEVVKSVAQRESDMSSDFMVQP